MPDVILVEPKKFGDSRGWFTETYKRSDFERNGISGDFRQDNHARSLGVGILRGLHFQKDPLAQGKLVRCTRGAIFDVAVDIRKGSPSYGRWVSAILSAENQHVLWVPVGFAHAYCTVEEECEVVYKTTSEYSPPHEGAIRWDDPQIGVTWPVKTPTLSEKDLLAPLLAEADNDFTFEESP